MKSSTGAVTDSGNLWLGMAHALSPMSPCASSPVTTIPSFTATPDSPAAIDGLRLAGQLKLCNWTIGFNDCLPRSVWVIFEGSFDRLGVGDWGSSRRNPKKRTLGCAGYAIGLSLQRGNLSPVGLDRRGLSLAAPRFRATAVSVVHRAGGKGFVTATA